LIQNAIFAVILSGVCVNIVTAAEVTGCKLHTLAVMGLQAVRCCKLIVLCLLLVIAYNYSWFHFVMKNEFCLCHAENTHDYNAPLGLKSLISPTYKSWSLWFCHCRSVCLE